MNPASSKHREPKLPKPDILFSDDDIVLVAKPAGVWPREGIFDAPGVFDELIDFDNGETLYQVYPLEMEISGVGLYARNEKAAMALVESFDCGAATVRYQCIAGISVFTEEGQLQTNIDDKAVRDSGIFGIRNYETHITTWKKVDSFVGYALLECTPQQRTPLQVRKHLADGHMPLAVDAIFGGGRELMLSSFKKGYRKSKRRPERALIARPSLHLLRTQFPHPISGDMLTYEAEYPKDFRAALHQLDRFARMH